ncbi:MAG: chemotaxis protein CheX [Bacilli bacterium]|nr:chemotaxis protein CheX [Bacilli bacterium]
MASQINSAAITDVLNGLMDSIASVVPIPSIPGKPSLISEPIFQPEMGVLIGVTGDIHGRFILEASIKTFGAIGQAMFGMALEGEMLESFTGELGNMIGGNMVTNVAGRGTKLDITPPTVIVGNSKLSSSPRALKIDIRLDGVGDLQVYLMLEETV